ncbi:MAG: DUF2235 domain-containing protein [Pseudomonadota bacterium]
MSKNILVFSDGTANDTGGRAHQGDVTIEPNSAVSNIYRLFVASRPHNSTGITAEQQVAFYDPGLGSTEEATQLASAGSSGFGLLPRKIYSLASRATGLGITRNILDCYRFLVEQYEPGDRIFLFGFSRGAYTVRSLGGLITLLGVLKKPADEKPDKLLKQSVEIYKIRNEVQRKAAADAVKDQYHQVAPHAICVFDTVRALGATGGIANNISRLTERFAPHEFHDHHLSDQVPFAFHAVSIDENRKHFAAELWENDPAPHEAFEQRWFPGVHSDIGGSYPDGDTGTGRDLGRMSLEWMLSRLQQHNTGFLVNTQKLDLKPAADAAHYHLGEQHDERSRRSLLGLIPTGWLWPIGYRQKASDAPLEPDANDVWRVGQLDQRVDARFTAQSDYRPQALRLHLQFKDRYH